MILVLRSHTHFLHQYRTNYESIILNQPDQPLHQLSPPPQSVVSHPMVTRSKAWIFKPKIVYVANCSSNSSEHASVSEALQNPKWFQAMKEEYKALVNNNTGTLFLPSHSVKIIGNKWVYRVQYNPDGSISRFKVRLVAKGFHQIQRVDYNEIFSPVVKASTIKIILSLAVMSNRPPRQLDINNAFLHGYLIEEVYMHPLEGFVDSSKPNHICKLQKAIYSLKQALRVWFDRLKRVLTVQWGFKNSKSDTSLFFKKTDGHLLLVLVYVDDIIITSSSLQLIK